MINCDGSSSFAHKSKFLWVVKSHTHRQVTSTILSIESTHLHKKTPARSLSRGLGQARSYNKVCHVTESRAIASRCPKLRTFKGHLVYKIPPTRSQPSSRKPTLRHARYKHTRNIHVQCEQQVSSHYSTKFTSLINS